MKLKVLSIIFVTISMIMVFLRFIVKSMIFHKATKTMIKDNWDRIGAQRSTTHSSSRQTFSSSFPTQMQATHTIAVVISVNVVVILIINYYPQRRKKPQSKAEGAGQFT